MNTGKCINPCIIAAVSRLGHGDKILIADGNYPLLSTAIDNGLFHPNCKDGLSTWFEGISRVKAVTPEEEAEMERREKLEQQKNYYNNQAEKNSRISEYSLDEDNKKLYGKRAEQFRIKAEQVIL